MSQSSRGKRFTLKRLLLVLGLTALAGIALVVYEAYRFVFHVAENDFAARACMKADGKPPSDELARVLLNVSSQGGEHLDATSESWLNCLASGNAVCGKLTGKFSGILSALPNRYRLELEVADGAVTRCQVSSVPGW